VIGEEGKRVISSDGTERLFHCSSEPELYFVAVTDGDAYDNYCKYCFRLSEEPAFEEFYLRFVDVCRIHGDDKDSITTVLSQ
jgi:hypothetical protein